jgi:hypothetical protein
MSLEETLDTQQSGAVRIDAGDETWTLGPGEVVATLHTDPFEAFRLLGGRRAAEQIRDAKWSGDVDAVIGQLSRYPLPERPLVEG